MSRKAHNKSVKFAPCGAGRPYRPPLTEALCFFVKKRWGPKVIHYGSKTVENKSAFGAEALITELFILICLIFFACVGYFSNLLVLLALCGVGAVAVAITLVFELYNTFTRPKVGASKSASET